jgi:exodeoxyribonuclease VII large subunit
VNGEMQVQLQNNTERGNRNPGPVGVSTVNQFLLALITKRLYEDLAEQELLWQVAGYLGSLDNKLRNDRVFWGVTLTEEGSNATESLKLTIPKEVLERSGAKARDYVCASGVLRVSQQFKASSFEVYLLVTDMQLLDAPGLLQSRREEASTLQTLKALATSRAGFPTKARPKVSVIHSRSQEAQVYADFCQPLRPFEAELQLEAIPANMLALSELAQAVRQATGDVLVLIRGGGREEPFGVFDHPDLLQAWAAKPAYRIVGVGHSANSTALDLLSNFVATTPAAAGVHIAELLRNAHEAPGIQHQKLP